MRTHFAFVLLLFLLSACDGESDTPTLEVLETIDTATFEEPSGIVYHRERGTFFLVSDNGQMAEMDKAGTFLRNVEVDDASFEGLTYNPATGLLYVAVEGEDRIFEVEPGALRTVRRFTIGRTFEGATVMQEGGQGIEGITFVPDASHPEGGTFYVSNQNLDLSLQEDPSALYRVTVPLNQGANLQAVISELHRLDVIDLSGVFYDANRNRIYVVSDEENALLEISRAGEVLNTLRLPGRAQEGITADDEGLLYITQDAGGILKIRWNR